MTVVMVASAVTFALVQVLCATRAGKKVADITVDSDKKTLLR